MKRAPVSSLRCAALVAALISGAACKTGQQPLAAAEQVLREGRGQPTTVEGRQQLREAVRLYRVAGSTAGQAEALYWLAIGEKEAREFSAATQALEEAIALHSEEAGFYDPTSALLLLGDVQLEKGDPEAARGTYERARQRAEAGQQRWNESFSLVGLGNSQAALGHPDQARGHFAQARSLMAEDGSLWGEASVLAAFGDFEAQDGNVASARAHYARAIELHRRALAALDANPQAPQRTMHLERSRRKGARVSLASAKLEASQHDFAAALRACEDGLKLARVLPTAMPEASSEWAAREDRELVAALERQRDELRTSGAAPAAVVAPTPASDEVRRAIRVIGEGKIAVQSSLVRAIQADVTILSRAGRIVPEQKDGKLIAWRTFAVRPETFWGLLGFQNGDQLLTVNDIPFVALETSAEAQSALKAATRFRVHFARQHVERDVELIAE
jgi:tetratricopeptide (TPR) repeat protein